MGTTVADRNLLFGLLALQTGLIDQGQLVNAFRAWTRDQTRAMADHLAARPIVEAIRPAGGHAAHSADPLSRIAFGSCATQERPQPIWTSVLASRPQLLLLLGDNIYADTKDMNWKTRTGMLR